MKRKIIKAVGIFSNSLYSIINELVPKRKKRIQANYKYPVWYTREIRNLKNRKQKAHKAYKKDKSSQNLNNYIEICRALDVEISLAYESFNAKVEANIKSDPKALRERKNENF